MPEAAPTTKPASPNQDYTVDQLRELVEAREQDIRDRLQSLQHELTTVADITVDGKPLPDYIRARPFYHTGLALAGGLVLGLLTGFRARAKRRPEMDEREEVLRTYAAFLLDDAAYKVAGGEQADPAVRKALSKRPPLVYYEPPPPPKRSSVGETLDVAVKTALGFGIKFGLDRLAQKYTHEDELFSAVKEAADDPNV